MLRKLFINSYKYSSATGGYASSLKKYLCVRESLNPTLHQSSINSFKSLLTHYKLSSEELMGLIRVLRLNPEAYRKYLNYNEFIEKNEDIQRNYRLSPFFSHTESLEARQANLIAQYPEVLKYINLRDQGLVELRKMIFPDNSLNSRLISKTETMKNLLIQFEKHVNELMSQNIPASGVNEVLTEILNELQSDYKGQMLDMKVFFEGIGSTKPKELTDGGHVAQPVEKAVVSPRKLPSGVNAKDVEELDNINATEFQKFLEESNQEELLKKHSVALATWVNDRKLVFQSQPIEMGTKRNIAKALKYVGFISLGAFIYALVQGDAGFLLLLALPAVGILSLRQHNKLITQLLPRYLQRIWVHRDGKLLDLETKSLISGIQLHKDIPLKELQVFKEGNVMTNLKIFEQQKELNPLKFRVLETIFRSSVFQKIKKNENKRFDLIRNNDDLHLASYYFQTKDGKLSGLIPLGNQKQKLVWESILQGKEIDTKQV